MKEKFNRLSQRVTLKQLRAIEAVVRTGSISKASQELNVTAPAVTIQIRSLEETVGMTLLERTTETLRPTDAGQLFLDAAYRCEATLKDCGEALEALKEGEGGSVAVGVISTAKYFAPRALAAFVKDHPKVDLRLYVGNRSEIISALRNYELDFAVMGRSPDEIEVEQVVIGDNPHIIVAPSDHPMASRDKIEISELTSQTFLLREEGSGTRLLMQRLFADNNLNPNIGMEIGSNETIKQAVMAGLGIALISLHTVAPEIKENRIVQLPVEGLPLVRQWFIVKLRDKNFLPAAQSLWDFVIKFGNNYLPPLEK